MRDLLRTHHVACLLARVSKAVSTGYARLVVLVIHQPCQHECSGSMAGALLVQGSCTGACIFQHHAGIPCTTRGGSMGSNVLWPSWVQALALPSHTQLQTCKLHPFFYCCLKATSGRTAGECLGPVWCVALHARLLHPARACTKLASCVSI